MFVPLAATRACFVIPRDDVPILLENFDVVSPTPRGFEASLNTTRCRIRVLGCVAFILVANAPRGFLRTLWKTLEFSTAWKF